MQETLPHHQVIAARRFLAEEFINNNLVVEPTPKNINYLAVCIGILEDFEPNAALPPTSEGLFKI